MTATALVIGLALLLIFLGAMVADWWEERRYLRERAQDCPECLAAGKAHADLDERLAAAVEERDNAMYDNSEMRADLTDLRESIARDILEWADRWIATGDPWRAERVNGLAEAAAIARGRGSS